MIEELRGLLAEHRLCGKPTYDGCFSHWDTIDHCRMDGTDWPCDASVLGRALFDTNIRGATGPALPGGEPAALDVDRLAQALHATSPVTHFRRKCSVRHDIRAAEIASAYVALEAPR